MKIIISPAKKMRTDADFLQPESLPLFLQEADCLRSYIRALSLQELQHLLCCNADIARLNYHRYQEMDLRQAPTPALLAYDGIQYQYMAPQVFETDHFAYVQKHLRILSGLYGILRPLDGVVPYRLEMQAKLRIGSYGNLYDFWGSRPADCLTAEDDVIINLASDEYSRAVRRHLHGRGAYITCLFGEMIGGKVVEKGVYVKMARGQMVRFMAENRITVPEDIKRFDRLGYRFCDRYSDEQTYVFIKPSSSAQVR